MLTQPLGSCHRMQESSDRTPVAYDDSHGFSGGGGGLLEIHDESRPPATSNE